MSTLPTAQLIHWVSGMWICPWSVAQRIVIHQNNVTPNSLLPCSYQLREIMAWITAWRVDWSSKLCPWISWDYQREKSLDCFWSLLRFVFTKFGNKRGWWQVDALNRLIIGLFVLVIWSPSKQYSWKVDSEVKWKGRERGQLEWCPRKQGPCGYQTLTF